MQKWSTKRNAVVKMLEDQISEQTNFLKRQSGRYNYLFIRSRNAPLECIPDLRHAAGHPPHLGHGLFAFLDFLVAATTSSSSVYISLTGADRLRQSWSCSMEATSSIRLLICAGMLNRIPYEAHLRGALEGTRSMKIGICTNQVSGQNFT